MTISISSYIIINSKLRFPDTTDLNPTLPEFPQLQNPYSDSVLCLPSLPFSSPDSDPGLFTPRQSYQNKGESTSEPALFYIILVPNMKSVKTFGKKKRIK